VRTKYNRQGFKGTLTALLAIPLFAAASGLACDPSFAENFDSMRSPLLPAGWVASQGVNVTGAPFWVTSTVTPETAPNDAFSTAPDNILDNRLDTPLLHVGPFDDAVFFQNNYNLESGRDGAVLEISSPNINGGAFTDITDPAVGGIFFSGGYNATISTAFESPIAGRMAWSGNSGGYIPTFAYLGNAAHPNSHDIRMRFRMASDNNGASAGWRIDTFSLVHNECPSPTPTPSTTPTATPTATPIASPCGSPNVIADPTFEAGVPWSSWTVQTSTNFGTPLCNTATCGTGGGAAPPYAGDNWAWFGGADAAETATLGQSVTIMAGGQAILSFVMRIGTVSPPFTDVLNVRVDGTIVQSYSEATEQEFAYSLRTIDLSAFADGSSHLILFEYIGPSTGTSNYVVDNVSLITGDACSSPTPSPTATATATATPTATATATPTATATATPTATATATPTATATATPTATAVATPTPTVTATPAPATPTPTPSPTPTPTSTPSRAQALNISTRLRVETGDNVMIGGFIITGSDPKRVAIRGIGPSLGNSGLNDVLADPTLELRGSDVLLMQNDNWQDDSAQAAELTALGLSLQDPNESGIVATLQPGAYTVIMAGKNQTSGIGLVEIYDADAASASQLANISTRGFVQTGDNVMIGGFILGQGTAGADVVQEARSAGYQGQIIIFANSLSSEDRQRYRELRVDRVIDKPGKTGELMGAVSELRASLGEPERVAR
jgi:hypothetical protein